MKWKRKNVIEKLKEYIEKEEKKRLDYENELRNKKPIIIDEVRVKKVDKEYNGKEQEE